MSNPTNQTVLIGPAASDEMCNFYLMFSVPTENGLPKKRACWSPGPPVFKWAGKWDPLLGEFGGGLTNIPNEEASKMP